MLDATPRDPAYVCRTAPRATHWEKAWREYIELRGAFYDVWPLLAALMTRVSAPLLEIAATSVRRPRGDPLPFHSLQPCFPTPDPAPCTCHLNTHREAKCFPRAPAQPRCVYPCLEAAGEAGEPMCMYIPHARAQKE